MSCARHHRCPCTEDLMIEMEESLRMMVTGLESALKSLPPHVCQAIRKHVHNIESSKSVLRRANKI